MSLAPAEAPSSPWWRSTAVALAAAGAIGSLGAAIALRGTAPHPADFTVFAGRFHPLVVHLPIGALVLVVLIEALTVFPRYRDRVDVALAAALPASVIFAAAAFVLGLLLARAGGYSETTVAWHRGLTLAAIVGLASTTAAFTAALQRRSRGLRLAYRGLLGATMAALTVGAHFGGTLSRGSDYLTRYAPAPVRALLGVADTKAPEIAPAPVGEERLVYRDVVAPILEHTCVECHGAKTRQAKLRLDSLDAIMKGGESGPAAIAGNGTKSPLYARLLLPESSDDHMPPPNHPAPSAAERELLRWWIDRGATDTLRVADALPPVDSRELLATVSTRAAAAVSPIPSGAPKEASAPPSQSSAPAASSAVAAVAPAPPLPPPAADGLVFRDVVEPILNARCASCHGTRKEKGKLRVDSFAALLKGGEGGPAIVPGRSSASLLVTRMHLPTSSDDHMPPVKVAQPSSVEIETVAYWIDHGATEALPVSKLPARLRGGDRPAPPPPASAIASGEPSAPVTVAGTAPTATPLFGDDVETPSKPASPPTPAPAGSATAAQTPPEVHARGCAACAIGWTTDGALPLAALVALALGTLGRRRPRS